MMRTLLFLDINDDSKPHLSKVKRDADEATDECDGKIEGGCHDQYYSSICLPDGGPAGAQWPFFIFMYCISHYTLLRLAAARLNAASLFQINMLGASDSRGVI
jgi:hypothetical protein